MHVLIIDNYDSFTFNLYQYVGEILTSSEGAHNAATRITVKRNDEITLDDIRALDPERIIISPGPGTPQDDAYFGVCKDAIVDLGKRIPLLGVCLGMQGIAHCFGGRVVSAPVPMHGKVSAIAHDAAGAFKDMPQGLEVMRYHSLMVEAGSLPQCLAITAIEHEGPAPAQDVAQAALEGRVVMGLRHREYPIEGIQFHPESFATEGAKVLLMNFLFQ